MVIGRKEEIEKLKKAYNSDKSEFVVVYGRRRIGKTFLIRETFDYRFTFQYSGVFKISNQKQLEVFYRNLLEQGLDPTEQPPKDWFDAFFLLQHLILRSNDTRKVIFLDELPWMDARNSHFIPAFEHFWNGWASARKDILLIICGSATSWIINKIFRNKGGLYNRATYRLKLQQFSLHECEELAHALKLPYNRNMLIEGYMVMGGVPFYWTKLDNTISLGKNIDNLFLKGDSELHDEFNYIYSSMFNTPEKYIKIVQALSGKKSGMTRDEIISKAKIDNNGHVSRMLEDLIECGFVRKYCHTGKRLKDALYQLVDCYTLFYYQFVRMAHGRDEEYWVRTMQTPTYSIWCGLAFERVCLLHTRQIKTAIGISGIKADLYSWFVKKNDEHPGVQIDLIIDRADNMVNICEMKYAPKGFRLTNSELKKIQTRISTFELYAPRNKAIQPILITSNGTIANNNSFEIPLQVVGEQLFLP
ncbi:MAG: ATP-binding protein [Muribaculaceae bacterium]|nr:ATP-binding protein [Muribaculaceae bacterium]